MKRFFGHREWLLLGILAALFGGFAWAVDGFYDWFSIMERTRYWVVTGLLAVPLTFIIATGGIDLSVGSMVALGGVVIGLLYEDAGWPIWLAATAALVVGFVAGACNGTVSSYFRIPPLVVTLATMTLYRGLAMGLSQGRPISDFPPGFLALGQGDLFEIPAGASGPVFFPAPLLALIVVFALGWLFLHRSWVGRYALSLGENPTAARFAAIPVPALVFGLYAGTGLICGVASLFYTAIYSTAKANLALNLELEAIACVIVGGTRISGGQASITGTLLGLLILGILKYGLEMANVPSQYIIIVTGALIVVSAVLNEWTVRRHQTSATS